VNGFIENGMKLQTGEYIYDQNGNMVTDLNKGIVRITYNYMNLPVKIELSNKNRIENVYDAGGIKVSEKIYTEGTLSSTTDYCGEFVYKDNVLAYMINPEGRVVFPAGTITGCYFEYQLKDHLGNVRVTYTDKDNNSVPEIVNENHYYPFGMVIGALSKVASLGETTVKLDNYLYNGKEEMADFGLRWLDYGARMYDPVVGRWWTIDPMAEKYYSINPYCYVANNPMIYIDPTGMLIDDFSMDKEGNIKLVKKTDDKTDRIVKTDKAGNVKENRKGIDGIEKGILKDGQNFKKNNEIISVGGEGKPSVAGVKSFVLKLSEYVGKEIKGFSYSSDASGKVTDMLLGKYKDNTFTESFGDPSQLIRKYGVNYSSNNILEQFHAHPDGDTGATESAPELSTDVKLLQTDKPQIPNASFKILYRITGQERPAEYDYTHEYKSK